MHVVYFKCLPQTCTKRMVSSSIFQKFSEEGLTEPLPRPLPRFVSGFVLGLGFALNSQALCAFDSGFALDSRVLSALDSGFFSVCLLNPIRQTSIPRPYTVISLLSFHHCSSQPSQYLSVLSRAYTRLLNESIVKQRLSPGNVAANREPGFLSRPWLMRISNKKGRQLTDYFVKKRSWARICVWK